MAFNLMRAISLGRRAYSIVKRLQDQSGGGTAPAARRNGRQAGVPSHDGPRRRRGQDDGQVDGRARTDAYAGDFTGRTKVEYSPVPGEQAGPGEIVWTWVPFEELDGRGKDRPVLIVGTAGRHLLGLQLTSKDRNNAQRSDAEYVDIGSGAWDRQARASEVNLGRIVRVDPDQVRREGGVLPEREFERVAEALREHRGWSR